MLTKLKGINVDLTAFMPFDYLLSIMQVLYILPMIRFHIFWSREILYLYSVLKRLKNRRGAFNLIFDDDDTNLLYVLEKMYVFNTTLKTVGDINPRKIANKWLL